MVDDDDRNILVTADPRSRFPDFDLYKHIAKVHNAVPSAQVYKPPFSRFQEVDCGKGVFIIYLTKSRR
jgi:hypothetical protein